MSYPNPTYRDAFEIGCLSLPGGRHIRDQKEMYSEAVKGIYEYLRANTYVFHGSSEGKDGTYKKTSALTPQGIVINCVGNWDKEWNANPLDLTVTLLSFTTPVDGLSKRLQEIAQERALRG